MKIYKIPHPLQTIIFDIDSTLYTNAAYAFEQVDVQVRHYAALNGISDEKARQKVSDYRKRWAAEHGGQKISLANTLLSFGVPIATSVEWRKTLIEPADFLGEDKALIAALSALKQKYRLICVTNNPALPAQKTLDALRISSLIEDIIALDTCWVSKPAREPFALAAQKTGAAESACLSVGDRYDIDLALPLEMGMGAIEVAGVQDVYELPSVLS